MNETEKRQKAEDIADYVLLKEDSLGDDEIQEILDTEDKDNE